MKKIYFISIIVLTVSMVFLPLASGMAADTVSVPAMADDTVLEPLPTGRVERVRVLRSESGETIELSISDYLFCVVAAEMPALYETEALKAQAVAAYTYLLYKVGANSQGEYDITDDSKIDQAFVTTEAAREKWGENADTYEEKIRSAVNSVLHEKITYNGELIMAAYHAISSGKTENAVDIWGGNYAYLSSVESNGDKLAPEYLTTVELSSDDFVQKMSSAVSLEGNASGWIGEIDRTESGSVITAVIGGKSISGSEIRKLLSLRSANFDVSVSDSKIVFTVRGYGHGVGMSQYGAHYMAMQGKNYKEIISYYYTGCQIEK